MIIVHGMIPLRAESREQAMQLACRMAERTKTEKGCISYDFYVGLSDPNTLMLFQEWESMEALMGHFQAEHTEEFLRVLPELVSGEVITKRYAVQSIEENETLTEEEISPIIH